MGTSGHPLELLIEDVGNFLDVIDPNDRISRDVCRTGQEFVRLLGQYMEADQKEFNIQLMKNCWSKTE